MKAKYKIRKSRRKFNQLVKKQIKRELSKPFIDCTQVFDFNEIDFEQDRRKNRLK